MSDARSDQQVPLGAEVCSHPRGLVGAQTLEVHLGFLNRALERQGLLLGLYRTSLAVLPDEVAGRLAKAEQELDLPYIQGEVPKVMEECRELVERMTRLLRGGPDAPGGEEGYAHVG